ncbi:MAG: PASTA domain-containing protein [Bacteroidota bacterium]
MFRYFISREFFLTLVGLGVVGLLLYIAIFFVFLPTYTRHGDAVLVPDVNEVSLEEAENLLEENGLRSEVRDCTYIEDLPPLSIVAQYPVPLSRVKPKRKVFLTLNQKQPPTVKMPQVIDLSLYQAQARLESWKLEVGTVTRVPDIAENFVLRVSHKGQAIKSGELLPQGSKIDLVVGDGLRGGRSVEIPDLVGLQFEEALNRLRISNLGLGVIVYNPDATEDIYGQVYSQNPRPGSGNSVKEGYPIDLYIYGEEPESNEGVDL